MIEPVFLNQRLEKQYDLLSAPVVHRGLKKSGVALGVLVFNRGGTFPQWSPTVPENLLTNAKIRSVKALLLNQRRTLLQEWADYLKAAEDSCAA